ncbi:uncharacterized protein EV422DRAFT_293783 [Fimicolochytrium jonesii]|uniref:uncharacterized protein n=1 Tax=Fimicolochytrium jonesii TaxID=1396493 RepID=UPI0022FF3E37|nr:uncharacterized protein EV422DRAFT_293783 [Fimicolochytrium jonesii]KAI8816436.1 hypothetical protein EV422DRAFT_293783 [Fimicolochytrium jonesii]
MAAYARPESALSNNDGDGFRYVESHSTQDQLSFDADLSKVTVNDVSKLMPQAAESALGTSRDYPLSGPRKVGWAADIVEGRKGIGSRPPSRAKTATPTGAAQRILYPGDKTRPRVLVDMLQYLKTEIRELGAESAAPGDPRRLQVYGEVFERFIEEFTTYQPLLSNVKLEYDMALQRQQSLADKVQPLESQLAVQQYMATRELEAARAEGQRQLEAQLQANHDLHRKCVFLDSQLESLRHQHDKLSEEEYISIKIAEMREEMQTLDRQRQEELRVKETRCAELTRALRKAQEDGQKATKALEALQITQLGSVTQAVHGAVIKQRDKALEDCDAVRLELGRKDIQMGGLRDEITKLQQTLKRKEEDKYPDWQYIESMCPAGIRQYELTCKDKDYNDSIILLIREILRLKSSQPAARVADSGQMGFTETEPRFFVGLGLNASVPKHLRYKGKIRNRQLSRKNLCLLLRDVWTAKAVYDATNAAKSKRGAVRSTLADFLYAYLKKRFGSQDIVAEFGYNIHEACKKHRFQSVECLLFYDILTEQLNEDVHHHQTRQMERLKNHFYRHDVDLHEGKARGIVPKENAIEGLRSYWPEKTQKQLEQLRHAMDADQPGPNLTYRWLFQTDSDCMFLDIVQEQEMEMREIYIAGLTVRNRRKGLKAK